MQSYGGNFRAVLEIARESEELKRTLIQWLAAHRSRSCLRGPLRDGRDRRRFLIAPHSHCAACARWRSRVRGARRNFDEKYMINTPFIEDRHLELAEQVDRVNREQIRSSSLGESEDEQAKNLVSLLARARLLDYTSPCGFQWQHARRARSVRDTRTPFI